MTPEEREQYWDELRPTLVCLKCGKPETLRIATISRNRAWVYCQPCGHLRSLYTPDYDGPALGQPATISTIN